jgi:alkanesulfonate monooxygenase SsuD/methylene tetrahydromethanopterin reductase-like flavin-dependent oxidoreductase (luciferase family)
MEVGLQLVFQNTFDEAMSDAEMLRRETEIAVLAEEVGMDFVLAPEHHFDPGYSMCPDNMQWLSFLAARTSRMKVGPGAIILPWWPNPMRVAEKIAMLDILLEGRMMLCFGRGLARKEYEGFAVDMGESRQRFDQAAEIVLDILETGVAEYETEFFSQSRVELHPRGETNWRERGFQSVAMTPDSAMAAANLGAAMMSFIQFPWEQHHQAIEAWRTQFRQAHPGKEPGAPVMCDFTFCHEDPEVAERVATEYISRYYLSVIKHYDFDGSHWGDTQGYQAYQFGAEAIKAAGLEASTAEMVRNQVWGTPQQIIEGWAKRVEMTGELRPAMAVSFGGMPYDLVRGSLELIGTKVAPELRKLGVSTTVAA